MKEILLNIYIEVSTYFTFLLFIATVAEYYIFLSHCGCRFLYFSKPLRLQISLFF